MDNLFVAGDKAGHLMGIVEAVASGNLAGYNATRMATGMDCVVMPANTVLGDLLAYTHDNWRSDEGLRTHFCCNQGPFLQKMRKEGTYVKEFISGDDKKTFPSLSSLLEVHCSCKLLDVLEICD